MNPSATDWIRKYYSVLTRKKYFQQDFSELNFYKQLQDSGFIYGVSIKPVFLDKISDLNLTREELTKVNLIHCFFYAFWQNKKTLNFDEMVSSIIKYYTSLGKAKASFLQKLNLTQGNNQILENIISSRINETNVALKNNKVSIFTYAFLYADILGYEGFLQNENELKNYLSNFEKMLIAICFEALRAKKKKNKYDILLISLFAPNLSIPNIDQDKLLLVDQEMLSVLKKTTIKEKWYIMDLCCLAIWNDGEFDENEQKFISLLCKALNSNNNLFEVSSTSLLQFNTTQNGRVKLFEYTNPVKQVYKQSANTVKLLVLRNSSRLIKELKESGELVSLLGKSTRRDLNNVEKQKVREQLLDICKTIPSLTIFLLPGGTILLPLLIKFIPKLLPSAFDENRIKDG